MTVMSNNKQTWCGYRMVIGLIIIQHYRVCHGSKDIIPAKVFIKDIGSRDEAHSQKTPFGPDLQLNIWASNLSFRFKLRQCDDIIHHVPVYIPGQPDNSIDSHKTQAMEIDVYQSIRQKAWFYLHRHTNNSRTRVTGVFSSKKFLFTLRTIMPMTDPTNYTYKLFRRKIITPGNVWEQTFNKSAIEELPLIHVPGMRLKKRDVILHEIELLVAVDFSVFTEWKQHTTVTDNSDHLNESVDELRTHYTLLVHGINSRLKTISGPYYKVNLVLVGLYVATTPSASPWIYNISYESQESDRPVITSGALTLFSNWINSQKIHLPNFDHAMAFTANNLAHKENLYTLGVASQQSMCTDRSLSIIEDHGNIAYASFVATHELAHSLGAKHDGDPATIRYKGRTETCEEDGAFIMSPRTSSNPRTDDADRSWVFSKCSQLYFNFYIDHLNNINGNCLLHSDSVEHVTLKEATPYSPDEQCTRIHGHGSVMDRVIASRDPRDICRSIPCTKPGNTRGGIIDTLAMEGTVCGVEMYCQRGRCVQQTDGKTVKVVHLTSDGCIFGDQPDNISNTQMSCIEMAATPANCYKYGLACCSSCRQHLRPQTLGSNCSYGDKIPNCDRTMCENKECCETCAMESGSYTWFASKDTISVPENINDVQIVHKLSTGKGRAIFEMIDMSHPGFIVSSNGSITIDIGIGIDFELVQAYRLHIKAVSTISPRLTAIQVLTVIIQDVNEYDPVFEKLVYSINIPADILPGKRIQQVKASDADLSTTSLTYKVVYSKSNTSRNLFDVDKHSGDISVKPNNSLTNSSQVTFSIVIVAVDNGLPFSKTGTTSVMIFVGHELSGKAPLSYKTSLFLVLILHMRILKV